MSVREALPHSPLNNAQRSWNGCARCKRRRQKCDEQKPRCKRCQNADVQCKYLTTLRWGGRSFQQSRFGTVLSDVKNNVIKLEVDPHCFVYTTENTAAVALPATDTSIPNVAQRHKQPPTCDVSTESILNTQAVSHLTPYLEPLPSLSRVDRFLLHHFVHYTSQATSCHSLVHHDVCRLIIPMALQSPALFAATIALSATHRKSLSYNGSDAYDADKLIAGLKATSLRHLRENLSDARNGSTDSLIATIRTLCLCEVYAGADCPGTWRAHLEGARALIIALKLSNHPTSLDHDGSTRFLRRWFGVTEDMVALTADGFPQGTFHDGANFDSLTAGMSTESVYLDEYTGYSTDLSLLFREVGAAARQQHRARDIAQGTEAFGEDDISKQADILEQSLRRMIDRDKSKPPKFDSRVANSLSAQQAKEFYLCNEASQHTALIHLARRVRKLPASSPIVQKSVRRILDCIGSITSTPPSPLAVLTTPLFTAGCEALGTDRDLVRRLLGDMFRLMRIPNMRRTLEVLEEYWASSECKSNDGWESFMRRQRWDFLPY